MPIHGVQLNAWGKAFGVAWGNSWGASSVTPETTGRSGYWRLFFTQLQEQALQQKTATSEPKPLKHIHKVVQNKDGSATVILGEKLGVKPVVTKQTQDTVDNTVKLSIPEQVDIRQTTQPYVMRTMAIHYQIQRLFTEWNISGIIREQSRAEAELDDILLLLVA